MRRAPEYKFLKDSLYHALLLIPEGMVTTYKELARVYGTSPRYIGNLLNKNHDQRIPCFRVVKSDLRLADGYRFGGYNAQLQRLKQDKVPFEGDKVAKRAVFSFNAVLTQYLRLVARFLFPNRWPWQGDETTNPDEIVIGAILTQNTNWKNVEASLVNLRNYLKKDKIFLEDILRIPKNKLSLLIKPSNYYNQKATYLKNIANFILSNSWVFELYTERKEKDPLLWQEGFSKETLSKLRKELLKVKGVGEETADVLLTYAFNMPSFVVDAYTRRFLAAVLKYKHLEKARYSKIKELFEKHLGIINRRYLLYVFQRYHALIVLWGKQKLNKG